MKKIKMLIGMEGSTSYQSGRIYEVDEAEAGRLVKAQFAEYVDEKPAEKKSEK